MSACHTSGIFFDHAEGAISIGLSTVSQLPRIVSAHRPN